MPPPLAALSRAIDRDFMFLPSNAQPQVPLSVRASLACKARDTLKEESRDAMFLILAIVLVVLWLGGFVMFKSAGLLIHVLLLCAVISLIIHFISGRSTV
jgi:hypothetical protein